MNTTDKEKEKLIEVGYILSYPRHAPKCKICGEQLWEEGWKYWKAKQLISWYHDDCIMESPTVQKRIEESVDEDGEG